MQSNNARRNAEDTGLCQNEKVKIHFVTGKGGVGKSAVAAAMAFRLAQAGFKTLLVEIGPQSYYQDYFEHELTIDQVIGFKPLNFSPFSVRPHEGTSLDLALWTPQDCLKDYAIHLLKVENLYKLFFENPISKSLIQIAPGLNEISILGKITSSLRGIGPKFEYDYVVVDSYATGHFMSMLNAPRGLSKAITLGPMGQQSLDIFHILQNPKVVKYFIVSLPEELPTEESMDLMTDIRRSTGQSSTLLMNKILPLENLQLEDNEFDRYLKAANEKCQLALKKMATNNIAAHPLPFIFSINSAEVTASLASCLSVPLGLEALP